MGPETEKRAPSAKNIKKNLWRLPAIVAVAVSAGVYNENDLPINPLPQSDSTHTTIVLGKNNFTPSWENPLISPLPQADISQTFPEDLLPDEMITSQEYVVKEDDSLSLPSTSSGIIKIAGEINQPEIIVSSEISRDQVVEWLRTAGWPEELITQALEVVYCESRNRPFAVGDGGKSFGLFQLKRLWFDYARVDFNLWSNPVVNAYVGYQTYLYDIQKGNRPWKQWPWTQAGLNCPH